ncbi:MAG TPA: hypothetical protein VKC53_00745 [Patescibacteria group bacterium]|nr:hypothetical protein [Patescibacteria group bacterium]
MIDQNQTVNQNPIPMPQVNVPPQETPKLGSDLKSLTEKIKLLAIRGLNKFYSNKKIFWPVSISFGLILLIIILGLLFGRKNLGQNMTPVPTPPPVIENTPEASSSGDILIDSQNKLSKLKIQINNLDINESRLKPPAINFDIKF